MTIDYIHTALPIGLIISISGLIATWQKIVRNNKQNKEENASKILQAAKEEDALLRSILESKIEKLDIQLKMLELNVGKDLDHLKENYKAEIKVLGEKIEALRDELRDRHGQMVDLLHSLIESK